MTTTLFPAFRVSDADATIDLLLALGFIERLVVRDSDDAALVHHAEFAWGDRGGVMFGSLRGDGSDLDCSGSASMYLVVAEDAEVDRLHGVAVERGLSIVQEPVDRDHGGREVGFVDADGNRFSVGSYPGSD
ncbi:VOC family protein [Brachybacterium huguangmaarense]